MQLAIRSMLAARTSRTGALTAAALSALVTSIIATLIPSAAAMALDLQKINLRALVQACRPDYQRFCSDIKPGDGAILTCLKQHQSDLSQGCRDAAQSLPVTTPSGRKIAPASNEELPAGTSVTRDIAYGGDVKQRFDVYLPPVAARGKTATAPILVMVHGGAWLYGDKAAPGVAGSKAAYWLAKGYVFVSVNNRLVPAADPLLQAQDVAAALAKIQADAASWQADPARLVLMGHSAGAHLVTLLTADPTLTAKAGVKPWRGTVSLDSAAVSVEEVMAKHHPGFYDKAFGTDQNYWQTVSPLDRLTAKPIPVLMVCSSRRSDSCGPAREFAGKAVSLGGRAGVLTEDLTHEEISTTLGAPGDYTNKVEAFMQSVGLP